MCQFLFHSHALFLYNLRGRRRWATTAGRSPPSCRRGPWSSSWRGSAPWLNSWLLWLYDGRGSHRVWLGCYGRRSHRYWWICRPSTWSLRRLNDWIWTKTRAHWNRNLGWCITSRSGRRRRRGTTSWWGCWRSCFDLWSSLRKCGQIYRLIIPFLYYLRARRTWWPRLSVGRGRLFDCFFFGSFFPCLFFLFFSNFCSFFLCFFSLFCSKVCFEFLALFLKLSELLLISLWLGLTNFFCFTLFLLLFFPLTTLDMIIIFHSLCSFLAHAASS